MNSKNIYYVWDENLVQECDRLSAVLGRASMVHSLITAYGLLEKLTVVRSKPAADIDLRRFHSELYVNHLKSFSDVDEDYMTTKEDEEFGIGYDCPPVSKMTDLVSVLAGGTITAARCLTLGLTNIVLNWCGGWHHAQRHGAEGFCYVNDIVLGIEYLRQKFPKVLYIDLDVHHGNGVQDAYNLSKSVFTLSIHKFEPGFYPGTGDICDIGTLAGKGYCCNVPLHAFYSDETLESIFEKVFSSVYSHFAPDAIVLQCGADALASDPNGGACVTTRGYCACVNLVLAKERPTMLLGGDGFHSLGKIRDGLTCFDFIWKSSSEDKARALSRQLMKSKHVRPSLIFPSGYKHANTARLWTSLTALVTGETLDENIPEHSYWPQYGPDYTLAVQPTLSRDANKKTYLDECVAKIESNLRAYLPKVNLTLDEHKKAPDTLTRIRQNRKIFERIPEPNKETAEKTIDDVYAFTE